MTALDVVHQLRENINKLKGQTHLMEGTGQHYTYITKQDVIDYIDDAISKINKDKQTPSDVLNHITEEFLKYKLPKDVCVDGCVARPGNDGEDRYGTNLLDFKQAQDMFSALFKNYEINQQPMYTWGVDWSKHSADVSVCSVNKVYPNGSIVVVATSTSADGDAHGRIS